MQLAIQSSVRLMAGAAAHLCRAMAVFPSGGSIGFVVIVIFSEFLVGAMVGDWRRVDREAAEAGRASGLEQLLAVEAMAVRVWDME